MSKVICGTGMRPQNLPSGFDHKHPWKLSKLKLLEKCLLDTKPDIVISGMALGFDTYLAYVTLKISIPLHAYVPFEGFHSQWSKDHQDQFHKFLDRADKVKYICDGDYAAWKMHKRNEAMVNDSDLVIALWNPDKKSGGTYSTICYANQKSKPIINLWGENPEPVLTI